MSGVKIPSAKGLSTLVRPKFGPGMLLQHEDLDQLSTYTRELNRLMFRSLFGCGVICGLTVKTGTHCGQAAITVGAGLALNCSGDPIYVPKDQKVVIDEHCDPGIKGDFWVLLCPATKCCGPRPSMCPDDEDDDMTPVCTREREGFEIKVVAGDKPPGCACHCVPPDTAPPPSEKKDTKEHESECWCADPELHCHVDHYAGKCGCHVDECSGGGCDCVLLAKLTAPNLEKEETAWKVDHSVRRFIRPVLMRDPQVYIETHPQLTEEEQQALKMQQTKQALIVEPGAPAAKPGKAPKIVKP